MLSGAHPYRLQSVVNGTKNKHKEFETRWPQQTKLLTTRQQSHMTTSIFISITVIYINCIKIVFIIIRLLLLTIANEAFRKENISHPVSLFTTMADSCSEGGFTIQASL